MMMTTTISLGGFIINKKVKKMDEFEEYKKNYEKSRTWIEREVLKRSMSEEELDVLYRLKDTKKYFSMERKKTFLEKLEANRLATAKYNDKARLLCQKKN